MANEELGKYECGVCGETGSVYQSKRGKGRYLYKRCGCGCDQRNGAAVQTDLWFNTVWNEGAQPIKPPNVKDEPIGSQTAEKEPETTEPTPVVEKAETTSKKGPLALLGLVVLGALAFAS